MRQFWISTALILGIVSAAVLGVWAGATFHTSIAAALGHQPSPAAPQSFMAADQKNAGNEEKKILYYWDPMLGPSSISRIPGKSAMGMDLVPVYSDEVSGGPTVTIDPAVVQNMGVQTAPVSKGPLRKTVRTVGYLEVPETGLYDITLKVSGYIDKLYADETGMHVHKGDPLFDLYSPDLTAAEEELIAARKSVEAMNSAPPEIRTQARELLASARRKLQLWDIPGAEIAALARQDHAPKDITIRSPAEGHLEDKMIVQGSSVQAGMKLMRLEDHRKMWLEAKVYEEQLPMVHLGEMADATLEAIPGRTFSGRIVFINPHLDHMNRTDSVRIELDNPEFSLKPGMYATVQIRTLPVEDAVLVPGTAVIDTGTHQLVFVAGKQGHFSPRLVTIGLSGDNDQVQVLSGLASGEMVVTSGQFLMDVESRTLEAAQKFLTPTAVPAPATESATVPAATTETNATLPGTSGESDRVVQAYLAVASYLQQDHAGQKPADVSGLVRASGALAEKAANPQHRPLAKAVKEAASVMANESLDAQHKSFEKVGAAMLALIEKEPPSTKIAAKLYVMNCPMEKANWLQTVSAVTNPFLPAMRTCGSVTRVFTLNPVK